MVPDFMGVARGETVNVAWDDGWYVARDEETGVTSQGETVTEALANLGEALDLHLEPPDGDPPENPPGVPWVDDRVSASGHGSSRAEWSARTAGQGACAGEAVVGDLRGRGFEPAGRSERHAKLRYRHPEGEVRPVVVPLFDVLAAGTLRAIAEQADAPSLGRFLDAAGSGA